MCPSTESAYLLSPPIHTCTYSSGVKVNLSFKSAPAQKASSLSLAKINALVLPFPTSACRPSTTPLSSDSSCFDIALRALGLFSDSTAMLPVCGAGTLLILMLDDKKVLYRAKLPLSRCRLMPCWPTARVLPASISIQRVVGWTYCRRPSWKWRRRRSHVNLGGVAWLGSCHRRP